MRDLYNRDKKLLDWIKRADTELEEPDRTDVLLLVRHMQDQSKSKLWIVRNITALILMRKQITKPYREASVDDIRHIINWMDEKEYKAATIEKFRIILRTFYKIVFGNNKKIPKAVNWFNLRVDKDRLSKEKNIDIEGFLVEEEIQKLIAYAPTIQKKALISCIYESGARPEEFLRLTNRDIHFETTGIAIFLRGKTGERRVLIIAFAPLLRQWLDIHPLKENNNYPLWISEATSSKNNPLGIAGAEKIIKDTMMRAKIQNKKTTLYVLRHSRATFLASRLTEAQMCIFFGWTLGSKVIKRYVHLSGRDLDNTILSITGITSYPVKQDSRLKPTKCIRCKEILSPGSAFCGRCGLSINLYEQYSTELEEKEKKDLEIDLVRKEMNQKFEQIMELIQQNNKLADIKPEVLSSFLP